MSNNCQRGERAKDHPAPFDGKEVVFSIVSVAAMLPSRHIEKVTATTLGNYQFVCSADAPPDD